MAAEVGIDFDFSNQIGEAAQQAGAAMQRRTMAAGVVRRRTHRVTRARRPVPDTVPEMGCRSW